MSFLEALLPSQEVITETVRKTVTKYPMIALREIVANALIHQDFTENLWSCYLHACLKYLKHEGLTNSSLRQRFGLENTASAQIYFFRQNCNFLIYVVFPPPWCLFYLYGVTNHERNHPFQQSFEHD